MTNMPTILDLLKAGVHYGHKKGKWNPKMAPFIFGQKKGIHIINVEKTQELLQDALLFVKDIVAKGGTVVFVGTKKQAQDIVKKHAMECGMPYVTERWLGGMLTNFSIIFQVVKKYKNLKDRFEKGEMKRYTKKEQSKFQREMHRHDKLVGGLATLTKLPEAIYVVDVRREDTAVREALRKNIPIIAMCDTNADPEQITKPIPANDDATKSIELITALVAESVMEGKKMAQVQTKKESVETSHDMSTEKNKTEK